jgi:hypothetical protein
MLYHDLRRWIERADELGEIRKIAGADWNLEIGAITVDACRPYQWAKDFPPVSGASAELKERVLKKFGKQLVHAKS